MTTLDIARSYVQRGWAVVPVPARSKNPGSNGWQDWRLLEEELPPFFNDSQNIGALNGEPSGWRVDVDLDSPEAVALAPHFLPKTAARFGRRSKRESHALYIAPGTETKKFQIAIDGKSSTICELRSTGSQTIVPGSVHPEGEPIEWDEGGEPATVDAAELLACVSRLATAALLVSCWPRNARHDASLALGGGLLRDGWALEDAVRFVRAVAEGAGDDEVADRVRAVRDTAKRLQHDEKATGWTRLAELIGERPAVRAHNWLESHAPRNAAPLERVENGRRLPTRAEPSGSRADPRWVSAEELAAEATTYVAPVGLPVLESCRLIFPRRSHILSAPPKAGKTTLLVQSIPAWCALGRTVLYCTEESRDLWLGRVQGWPAIPQGLDVLFALGQDPAALLRVAYTAPHDITILDTGRSLLQFEDENSNSEVAARIRPWTEAQIAAGNALILALHARKGGGAHGEAVAGAGAFLALVDVVLELRWGTGDRRILSGLSREVTIGELLYERGDDGVLRPLGSPADVRAEELRQAVLDTLTTDWQRTAGVVGALTVEPAPTERHVRRVLAQLADAGQAYRQGGTRDTEWRRSKEGFGRARP